MSLEQYANIDRNWKRTPENNKSQEKKKKAKQRVWDEFQEE